MAPSRAPLKRVLACAGVALTLFGCAQEADQKLAVAHDQGRPGKLMFRPRAPTIAAPVPPTDALHFDLECRVHRRVTSDHPAEIIGTYPAGVGDWRYSLRYTFDLQTRRVCDTSLCARYGPFPIVRLTPDLIVLDDRDGVTQQIRRRDGRYEQRMEDSDQLSVTRGRCVRASYSGFPPREAVQ